MSFTTSPRRTHIGAAFVAAVIQLALLAAVMWGLAERLVSPAPRPPTLITITPRAEPRSPPSTPTPDDAGAAAPPNRKSEALPVVAPKPPVVVASPRPAANAAAQGHDASAGGSGTGAGSGTGGSGAGGGAVSAPLRIAGRLDDRDYPRAAGGAGGTVAIAFRVRADGRVDRCVVIGSSGEPLLDGLTCDLVERRFRYRPARDGAGSPVDATLRTSFTWGARLRD